MKIQDLILKKIYKQQDNPQKANNFDVLMKHLKRENNPKITQQFCTLDARPFTSIIDGIYILIQEINKELDPFCLSLDNHGISTLHQLA